jgi:hypothetical protein
MTSESTATAASADEPVLADSPAALLEAERAALLARRRTVLGEAAADAGHGAAELGLPRVGLALSGGGVRSATFAIGLMRGLAQSRVDPSAAGEADPARRTLASDGLLGRLDYLSTVSGGGYAGGMFGRLVSTYGLHGAQALMARGDSPVLAWLRRNGRYLTPSGSRDLGIAVVTYLRAWLAIHTEFLFASMLLGLLVMAPHLVQHGTQWLDARAWEGWQTLWWPMAALFWVTTAPALITAYWAGRDAPDPAVVRKGPPVRDLVFLLVLSAIAYAVLAYLHRGDAIDPRRDSLTWPCTAALALLSCVLGQVGAQLWLVAGSREPHALKVARLRNRMTRALRAVSCIALGLAGMGALDGLSWWILEELQSGNDWLWSGVGAGGLMLLVLRGMVQPLQRIAAEAGAHAREWLPRLLDLAGLAGLVALVVAWLVLMQWFVFAPATFAGLSEVPAGIRAGIIGLVWLTWVVLTAGNAQMANTSSLHSFYRARLTRAYLAVGNRKRFQQDGDARASDVTLVVDGDDASLEHYRPEANGGPIHLVNTCLNQTRDDQSGLYNADRKGTAVTASWRGFEVGPGEFVARRPGQDAGTLGRWVAVSGAAASPGAGAYTSRGLALLVYFLGVRLGYWMRSPRRSPSLRWLSRLGWARLPKPLMLASEASATFFGTDRPWWYLSDGGHFENTAVYALLKRELDFIILSDASCDAAYSYGDMENLVRKARIDLGAEIDFYTREEASRLFSLAGRDLTVLSPEEMADNHSCRGVLLARIRYRERPGPRGPVRPEGTLLVVKPNLHDALDVDVLSYAQQHTDFPHESTGDQSFDEAQWESYHRLGEDFGRALHDTWLSQLPGWRSPARHGIRVAARLGGAPGDAASRPAVEPLWRRSVRATALGTTLGVGASGTLLLSLWQAQEQFERNRTDQQSESRQLLSEVSKGLQDVDGACPAVAEGVVTQASLLLDLRGSPNLRPLENAGLERLATRVTEECEKPPTPSEACVAGQRRMHRDLCSLVRKPPTQDTALNYWHPGISPDEQVVAARKVWSSMGLPWPGSGPSGKGTDVAASEPAVSPPPPTPAAVGAEMPPLARPRPAVPGAAVPFSLGACQRPEGPVTLYVQVYDEVSRTVAEALRQQVQKQIDETGLTLQVAPVENVARTAQLRQQRRPVPWAQATFVLHDRQGTAPCAWALARLLGEPWVPKGQAMTKVWVRELPGSLKARPGVIELWLPPVAAKSATP